MVAPLRRVAMRRSGPATFEADPAVWHYARRLDATRLAHQYDLFARHIEHSGAEIEWIPGADDGLADSIFGFDPSFMTPHGAIVLRPSKALRVPEVHLQSLMSPLDRDLALVHPPLMPVALYRMLRERGIECLANEKEFVASGGLSVNVLALGPLKCLTLAGYPRTPRTMKDAGCEVTCFMADALCLPCEGGPTCLTLPVWRG